MDMPAEVGAIQAHTPSVWDFEEVQSSRQSGPLQSLVSARSNRCWRTKRSTALRIHWGASDTVLKG